MKHFILIVFLCLISCQLFARKNDYYKNVRVERPGNIFINGIPQVSQKRNYCVPASVSMILRYFDSRINQKKLAKLFSTTSEKGTMTVDMTDAFLNESVLRNFELKSLYVLTEKDYSALLSLYESSVSKKRAKHKKRKNDDKECNLFDDLKPNVARKLFPAARPDLINTFRSVYSEYICSGIPVLWAVAMNLDPAVNMKGGHMRVIVGFNVQNKKIKKVLYRDPWGSAKIKQVDFDDALTMTLELHAIVPESYTPCRNEEVPDLKVQKN